MSYTPEVKQALKLKVPIRPMDKAKLKVPAITKLRKASLKVKDPSKVSLKGILPVKEISSMALSTTTLTAHKDQVSKGRVNINKQDSTPPLMPPLSIQQVLINKASTTTGFKVKPSTIIKVTPLSTHPTLTCRTPTTLVTHHRFNSLLLSTVNLSVKRHFILGFSKTMPPLPTITSAKTQLTLNSWTT